MNHDKKALSIRQPWAWLIVNGYKDIENRTWNTKIREKIYIHAGKSFDKIAYEKLTKYYKSIQFPNPAEFDRGGLVGLVEIADCVQSHNSVWFEGPYGLVLKNPEPISFVKMKGRLGFFYPQFPYYTWIKTTNAATTTTSINISLSGTSGLNQNYFLNGAYGTSTI